MSYSPLLLWYFGVFTSYFFPKSINDAMRRQIRWRQEVISGNVAFAEFHSYTDDFSCVKCQSIAVSAITLAPWQLYVSVGAAITTLIGVRLKFVISFKCSAVVFGGLRLFINEDPHVFYCSDKCDTKISRILNFTINL